MILIKYNDIVTKAAYDHVKSTADVCFPVSRVNCSDRELLARMYFCATETKSSADRFMDAVTDLNVSVVLA